MPNHTVPWGPRRDWNTPRVEACLAYNGADLDSQRCWSEDDHAGDHCDAAGHTWPRGSWDKTPYWWTFAAAEKAALR